MIFLFRSYSSHVTSEFDSTLQQLIANVGLRIFICIVRMGFSYVLLCRSFEAPQPSAVDTCHNDGNRFMQGTRDFVK
jgi:hypothetical protein